MKMDEKQIINKKRVCVVVLGDFGRSPRMQYHAMSLAKHGFEVDVVAYGGSRPHGNIQSNSSIHQHLMNDPPDFTKYFPRILTYFLKVFWQTFVLLKVLFSLEKPTHILLQNPPSIPTLPVLVFVSWLRKVELVVDWHNYGHTILGLSLGSRHPLVSICCWVESFFGQRAQHHFCVTRAMKEDLSATWNIQATVLYDRPSDLFQPLSVAMKHDVFLELSKDYPALGSGNEDDHESTVITRNVSGTVELRDDRPAVVVSSTSWTADEDFSVLLDALESYEKAAQDKGTLPKILCLVTGKGHLRSFYEAEIEKKNFQHVQVLTMWLSPETYPKLLACGDLGVSLHGSSSGLDLPMKVVDMYGCGLPVCALTFSCLYELLKHGENGFIFNSPEELFGQLIELFENFPKHSTTLEQLRTNNKLFRSYTWDQSWTEMALPLFHRRRH